MFIEGLEEIDNRILTLLEKNARLTFSEIGKEVGLSRVSVKSRMENLEKKGIIRGYTIKTDSTQLPQGRRFFLDITVKPEKYNEYTERLAKYDVVRKIYAVTGECTLRVEGFASSPVLYQEFMKSLKNHLDDIRKITIQSVLYTIKDLDGGVDNILMDQREKDGNLSQSGSSSTSNV